MHFRCATPKTDTLKIVEKGIDAAANVIEVLVAYFEFILCYEAHLATWFVVFRERRSPLQLFLWLGFPSGLKV